MQITTIGLVIAKNVFQVHGIDAAEKVVIRKLLRRGQVMKFFAALPPCLVGMEACASAHYWARELTKLGHEVGFYGHAESKKTQKFVFRSTLRPNQISFSHNQDPLLTLAGLKFRRAAVSRRVGVAQNDNGGNSVAANSASARRHCACFNAPQHKTVQASLRKDHSPHARDCHEHRFRKRNPERWVKRRGIAGRARPAIASR
jgi:hypothetical protein